MSGVRRRIVVIVMVVVASVAAALIFEAVLSVDAASPFGHTRYGHAVGWLGLAVTLLVFVYPYRKRHAPERRWPRGWFRLHMVAGVVGPLLIFLHSGAHYHAVVPILAVTKLAAGESKMARGLLQKVTGWLIAMSLATFGMVPDMNGSPFPVAAGELDTGSSSREGSGVLLSAQERKDIPHPIGDATQGQPLYDASCIVCHGAGATGGIGPRLAGNPVLSNDEVFWDRVLKGRHMMPPLADALTPQQIADIQAWLKTLR